MSAKTTPHKQFEDGVVGGKEKTVAEWAREIFPEQELSVGKCRIYNFMNRSRAKGIMLFTIPRAEDKALIVREVTGNEAEFSHAFQKTASRAESHLVNAMTIGAHMVVNHPKLREMAAKSAAQLLSQARQNNTMALDITYAEPARIVAGE